MPVLAVSVVVLSAASFGGMAAPVGPILLIEDSPSDAVLTHRALQRARVVNEIHVVPDGDAALDFLHCRSGFEQARRPELVLLDLHLPGVDGLEVLTEMRQTPDLAQVPVLVLTSSRHERDIIQARELEADAYLVKPVDFPEFLATIQSLSTDTGLAVVTSLDT